MASSFRDARPAVVLCTPLGRGAAVGGDGAAVYFGARVLIRSDEPTSRARVQAAGVVLKYILRHATAGCAVIIHHAQPASRVPRLATGSLIHEPRPEPRLLREVGDRPDRARPADGRRPASSRS